ncbi:MAG: amidohydrolase family protein, partial [Planctomycetota bacterium]|nr:amidohydrolase family protein [Planctomycetota bacterium]
MGLIRAQWILDDERGPVSDGAISVEHGQIAHVATGKASIRRLANDLGEEPIDLGPGILCPGLVNAHAHLELTALGGRLAGEGPFSAWVGHLLRERAACAQSELAQGIRLGEQELLASGTTAVGEISSLAISPHWAVDSSMAVRLYHECLDAGDVARTHGAVADLREQLGATALPSAVSPHAPFSVSPDLFTELGELSEAGCLPITIHWAESPEEQEYLLYGEGPLAEFLGPAPRRPGLDLIDEAGLLGPRTSLVHGNYPAAGEPERLAAAGVSLVHCPGTHHFFGRDTFPLDLYRSAGVNLALGTDSLASNKALDMRREMALLRKAQPGLAPADVWGMATRGSARALDLQGKVGSLAPGARADMVLFDVESGQPEAIMDELTGACPPVTALYLEGRLQEGLPRAASAS